MVNEIMYDDASEPEVHSNCPLCGSRRSAVLAGYSVAHLHKCRACGMVYAHHIPTAADLQKHYSGYMRGRYVSELTIKRYEELCEEFEPYRKLNAIIDVGCGSGFFLEVAQRLGWEAHGTEYGEESVAHCKAKGLDVTEGDVLDADLAEGTFDVVTSFEVIEHLSFPLDHARRLFELLRSGGVLYITTPNFNSISRYLLKSKYSAVTYPEHLSYFSADTLDDLLSKAGFEKIKMSADGINVDKFLNSRRGNQLLNENLSPEVNRKQSKINNETLRQAAAKNVLVRTARVVVDAALKASRSGDFLKAYYRKPHAGRPTG